MPIFTFITRFKIPIEADNLDSAIARHAFVVDVSKNIFDVSVQEILDEEGNSIDQALKHTQVEVQK